MSLLLKYCMSDIHDMIITFEFRRLFEEWNLNYQLENGIIDIIKKFLHFRHEKFIIENNFAVQLIETFPGLMKDYIPRETFGLIDISKMIEINDHKIARFTIAKNKYSKLSLKHCFYRF